MEPQDYLLTFGSAGDLCRFRPVRPLAFRRGDRAVVETYRGLELGEVLCPATPGHAHYFVNTSVGKLLRAAGPDDEAAARAMHERALRLGDDGRVLAVELALPLEILDAEVLLDGRQGVLHHLSWDKLDERPFVSTLSKRFELRLTLHHLGLPSQTEETVEAGHGCGSCGSKEGGCGSCGSGGGGGCGSCHTENEDDAWKAHLAALREQMHTQNRMPLL